MMKHEKCLERDNCNGCQSECEGCNPEYMDLERRMHRMTLEEKKNFFNKVSIFDPHF